MSLIALPLQYFNMRMVTIAFITFFMLIIIPKIIRMIQRFRFFQSLPGEQSFSWMYGNMHKFPPLERDRIPYSRKFMEEGNRKFARFWMGPLNPVIALYHPDVVKQVLKSSAPKARGFGKTYELAKPWIGEGIISANGGRWARNRRLLTPAFHFEILKQYFRIYNQAADTLIEKLGKYAENGQNFDIWPMMTLCTLDIILKCAMGYDEDVQRQEENPYSKAVGELLSTWVFRARSPLRWSDFLFSLTPKGKQFFKNCDLVHSVAEKIIKQRKAQMKGGETSKKRHLDFLDILLTAQDEDGNQMSTQEIREEVDTFLFAGHDTTSSAVSWFMYTMAEHPEYQKKVQAEIDKILNGRENDYLEISDLQDMPTLSLCIKETQRLLPPVPFVSRMTSEELEADGVKFPAGIMVSIAITHMHRNPEIWENPSEFNPERFTSENLEGKDRFSFIPFSAGSRNCIGQQFASNELKVLVGRILRSYNVELAPDGPPVYPVSRAILKAEKGIWLKICKRQH